ncbi:MAG: YqcI/YcgG family protein [Gemmataceae bacterium]
MVVKFHPRQNTTNDFSRQSEGVATQMALLTQVDLEAGRSPFSWATESYQRFAEIVCDRTFPCTFAQAALKQGFLTFLPVESSTSPEDVRGVYDGIGDYLSQLNSLPPRQAAFHVLIVLVKPANRLHTVEEYHAQAWDLLQRLHDVDEDEWPEAVPLDPHHIRWAYCLHATPLFVNVSTPAHVRRRSRNLGPSLALVINPREAFDIVPGNDSRGMRARLLIRNRTTKYDGQPVPHGVGAFGEESSREWLQYCLPEENGLRPDERCPLTIRKLADRPDRLWTTNLTPNLTPNQE